MKIQWFPLRITSLQRSLFLTHFGGRTAHQSNGLIINIRLFDECTLIDFIDTRSSDSSIHLQWRLWMNICSKWIKEENSKQVTCNAIRAVSSFSDNVANALSVALIAAVRRSFRCSSFEDAPRIPVSTSWTFSPTHWCLWPLWRVSWHSRQVSREQASQNNWSGSFLCSEQWRRDSSSYDVKEEGTK